MDTGLFVISVIITLIILGVMIWLYVEQALFLFQAQNFTAQGWSDWRRILTIVFVILGLIGLCLAALGYIFGGSTKGGFIRVGSRSSY